MIGSEGGMPGPHRASAMGTRVASQREVARRLGISHTALQKAQRSGRIAPEPDGSWDIEKLRAQLARTADPARRAIFMHEGRPGRRHECRNTWIGYIIHHAPRPMLAVQPTVKVAQRFSDQLIDPLIEETPAIRERIAPVRSRTEHPGHHDRRNDERAHRFADARARRLLRRADGALRERHSGEHRGGDARRGRIGRRRHPQG
jgi:phage terminase large subunit GpA-like protein